jgi:hypothetical protein
MRRNKEERPHDWQANMLADPAFNVRVRGENLAPNVTRDLTASLNAR